MRHLRREHDITTPDGRTLRVLEAGREGGHAILVHNGTPCGRLLHDENIEDAESRGARLISWDRPGYGGSDRRAGRTVADVAADAVAVADALGAERFVTWGESGGGPHSLAVAALLPERCAAAASLAGVAPYDAEGLDWLADMGEDNVEEFSLALAGEAQLRPFLEQAREGILAASPEEIADEMQTLLSGPDRAMFSTEFAAYMKALFADGLAPGIEGWLDDDLAFSRDWGFDLAAIEIPVLLWQGEQDLMVPPAHGRWLAERIPGVEANIHPDEGHLTLIETRVPEVHAWLLERL